MNNKIDTSWTPIFQKYASLLKDVGKKVDQDAQKGHTIFPPKELAFKAFELTPFKNIKVVILGQDPYHKPGQAMGLSFSVPKNVSIPPSLNNIFKEMVSDLDVNYPMHGDLSNWAKQGVLLLNTTLSVREGEPGSHFDIGWEEFTDGVISHISRELDNVVFILWGRKAGAKMSKIETTGNLILTSSHPSPYSANRGFFGSKPFSKANKFLKENNINMINWEDL